MSGLITSHATGTLQIRIISRPEPLQFAPFDVSRFEPGGIYEVGPRLAELLIISGCAKSHPDVDEAADDSSRER
jgi:hypothetical protein